jgi:hypothetical protein
LEELKGRTTIVLKHIHTTPVLVENILSFKNLLGIVNETKIKMASLNLNTKIKKTY